MKSTFLKPLMRTCMAAALVTGTATIFIGASAEPAFANNGKGNGNGNANRGRGNSDRNAESRSTDNRSGHTRGNGRGAIASELKGLNAAHASATAMANASPNSMPGKLSVYRSERLALLSAVDDQNDAYEELQRLTALSENEIAEAFPNDDYATTLAAATETYSALRNEAVIAQEDAAQSLLTLTDGRELSVEAMSELHRLLGL